MQYSGFYVPTANDFIPCTVRKNHSVTQDTEVVSITTYGSGYPVTIRNAIITAKPLPKWLLDSIIIVIKRYLYLSIMTSQRRPDEFRIYSTLFL